MPEGHFIYTQVITDELGNIYDTRKFGLCDLCKEILPIDSFRVATHKVFNTKVKVCGICYSGPMVVR